MAAFQDRYQHAYNKLLWHVPAAARKGRFLDIGCGMGNGVVAALKHGSRESVGIDRSFEEFESIFSVEEFPALCRHFGVDAAQAKLIEEDIFTLRGYEGYFDYCMMLDSIEHVPEPGKFIKFAADQLKEGGIFLLDTCPLYYSMQGAHLFNHFSADDYPWIHLWHDFDELVKIRGVDAWSMERVAELNKVTHDDLLRYFAENGLDVIQEVRAAETEAARAALEKFKDRIKPEFLADERLLFEDWVLLVGRKSPR